MKRTHLIAILIVGVTMLVSACSFNKTVQVGSHRVQISRHGFVKSFHNDSKAATFHYDVASLHGSRYKVAIDGDKVMVNDREFGMLRKGDSVVITDHGLRVNSLDYGESEKYLRANSVPVQAAVN